MSRRGGDDDIPSHGVSRALVARPSSGQGKRSTRPRPSSRFTTWESRDSVAFVRWAREVIRKVRSGASESIARTKYSKWVSPESARSWASRTPGSSSTTAISRSQAARSSSVSHSVPWSRRSRLLDGTTKSCRVLLEATTKSLPYPRSTSWHTSPSSAPATWARPSPPSPPRAATPSSCSAPTTSPPPSPATSSSSRSPTPPSPRSSPSAARAWPARSSSTSPTR